jgi:ribosomal RNA assembly protein
VEQKTYVKIPRERIGALIGPKGRDKRNIEIILGVNLTIQSDSGDIEVSLTSKQKDVSMIFTARNIIKAIGRGFSPRRAMSLTNEDNDLHIIDLEEYVGISKKGQSRIKGRIIGKEGKGRALLEELTECIISVYGGTVTIIGPVENIPIAREAVIMLVNGAFHKTVWNHLYAYRRKMKKVRGELWYEAPRQKEKLQ